MPSNPLKKKKNLHSYSEECHFHDLHINVDQSSKCVSNQLTLIYHAKYCNNRKSMDISCLFIADSREFSSHRPTNFAAVLYGEFD